jgi:uncharacterized Tic20 family protein
MNKFLKHNLIAGFDSVTLFHNDSFDSQVKEALMLAKLRSKETGITIDKAIKKNFKERLFGQIAFVLTFIISLSLVLLMAEKNINEFVIIGFWMALIITFVFLKLKIKKIFKFY